MQISRRTFMKAAGFAAGAAAGGRHLKAAGGAKRPNFLWILSEDNSRHYLRLFDPDGAPAPAIESLAEKGVAFTRAYSNAPVCSVARTTLMTAVLGPRLGTHYHRKLKPAELPKDLQLFPAYLRAAGYYATNNRKKDYNCREGKGVWDESSGKATWRKRPSAETPFFHMQSTPVSHESRLHFPARDIGNKKTKTDPASVTLFPCYPDTPTFRYTCARYHDCMRAVDGEVRKLVGKLKEDGLLEDTFIFYFGDHGGVLPGSKGYIHEYGLHVPLVVRIPENWRDRVHLQRGSRCGAMVSFIDFGATVLHLAGVDIPAAVDGRPFMGPGIAAGDIEKRNETFGYADRFDEKYDMCRCLRRGRYKYIRNYQAWYPDGLQNNYRYKMVAYREWRDLHKAGKLNALQARFFEPRPPEELYDVEKDPHQVRNLAGDADHAGALADLRGRMNAKVKAINDLSFYPESHMVARAMGDPIAFGRKHAAEIARLVDVADLCLLPFAAARGGLEKAIASTNRWERYWAMTACGCMGEKAAALAPRARKLLDDEEPTVRVRAAEFLAVIGAADPRPTLLDVVNNCPADVAVLLALNAVVFVRDHIEGYPVDGGALKPKATNGQVKRRLEYLKKK